MLTAAEPQLFVSVIKTACDYFRKARFSVAFVYGEPPFYGR